jgi:hypothetical protein
LLGILGGGLLLTMERPSTEAARRRNRRKRAADAGVEEVPLPEAALTGLTGGIWEETMEICHFDAESGKYTRIAVATTTLPNYLNSGDTLYIDCCVDSECGYLPCYVPTGCIQGACAYDADVGASCALGDGSTGVCNSDAKCVSGYSTTQAPESSAYEPAPADYPVEPVATDYPVEPAPEVYEGAPGEEVWYS